MFEGIDEAVDRNRTERRAALARIDSEFTAKGLYRSGPRLRETANELGRRYEALADQLYDLASKQPDRLAAYFQVGDRLRDEYHQFRSELTGAVTGIDGGNDALKAVMAILDAARVRVEGLATRFASRENSPASMQPLEGEDGDYLVTEDGEKIVTEDGDPIMLSGDARVTDDGDVRVTEDGDVRVTEDGDRRVAEDGDKPTIVAASGSASGVGLANAIGETVWRTPPTPEQAAQLQQRLASASWTGIERRIAATPGSIEKVGSLIAQLDIAVEQCGLTNYEQQRAKALTGALVKLVSSPQPEWQLIVNILNSPVLSALWRVKEVSILMAGLIYWLVGNS